MRVFRRGLILAALLCAAAPSVAGATPMLNGVSGDACTGLVAEASMDHCGLFDIGLLTGTLTGSFENLQDAALFRFTASEETSFGASLDLLSSFAGFLGLFDEDLNLVTYGADGLMAQGFEIGSEGLVPLVDGETYILALLLGFNTFSGTPTSLLAGFSADDTTIPEWEGILYGPCNPEQQACTYSLSVDVESDGEPARVPEPGTLTLLGTGALAALVRRRSKKRIC